MNGGRGLEHHRAACGLGFGFVLLVCLAAPVRGGSHFLCCCKESNQRKQLIGPKST